MTCAQREIQKRLARHVKLWCSNTGSIDRTATSHFTRLSSAGDRFQNFNSLKTFKLSRRTPCGVVVIRRGTECRRIRVMGSSLWVHNSQKTCKLCHVLAAFSKHCMVPFSYPFSLLSCHYVFWRHAATVVGSCWIFRAASCPPVSQEVSGQS
jgi:hypothetical protein